jgi:hypothetical protein
LLFDGHLKMAIKVRGGVMNINGHNAAAIEIDMRDVLRAKKDRASNARVEPGKDYPSLVSQVSSYPVHEIDHLIAGLQGVREKLNNDGDRLHRELEQHAALSQSIIQMTEIISDSVATVGNAVPAPEDVT